MIENDWVAEHLADFRRMNSFKWHPKTDIRIAYELYGHYICMLDNNTHMDGKQEIVCLMVSESGAEQMIERVLFTELFVRHVAGENYPETLSELLKLTGAIEKALAKMSEL
jgi:hypothetical protein